MAGLVGMEYGRAIYHIMIRGDNRRKLFYDNKDRMRFLIGLKEMAKAFGVGTGKAVGDRQEKVKQGIQEDRKLARLVSAIFLIFLAPSIHAADFTIDTTADFDAGTKSESEGNREVITESDVVSGATNAPAADELQLENLFSDKMDVADDNAITWKWKDSTISAPSGVRVEDIDTTVNDAMYLKAGNGASAGNCIKATTLTLTGDFSVQIKMNLTTFPSIATGVAGLFAYNDIDNRFGVYRQSATGAGEQYLRFLSVIGGVVETTILSPLTDNTISIRLRRVGTTLYGDYDAAQGESWTTWTKAGGFSGDVDIDLRIVGTSVDIRDGSFNSFKINSGTFASGGYRASGNWTSAEQTMPAGERMAQTTVYHSGLDAANCIDKVEWLVGGEVKAAYEIDITGGVSTTIKSDMVTSGSFAAVNADFQVKLCLVGDGSSTPIVTKVEGETEPRPGTTLTFF